MGTCQKMVTKKKACGKPDFNDTGFCAKHGGRVVPVKVAYAYALLPPGGGTTVDAQFAAAAQGTYAARTIEKIKDAGPGAAKKPESVKSVMLSHETMGKGTGTHASIFYKWGGNTVHIYAIGGHPGDDLDKYELMWHDGSSFNYNR